jgi:hypothetical protein
MEAGVSAGRGTGGWPYDRRKEAEWFRIRAEIVFRLEWSLLPVR